MDEPAADTTTADASPARRTATSSTNRSLPLFGLSAATIVAIFVGGALGTVARYLLEAHHPSPPGHFPWVTLLVNLSGSLAIGLLVPLTEHVATGAPLLRPFLVVGFLGGWTTYSTLAVDATLLAKDGDVATCLAYLAATVAGGLALVVAGPRARAAVGAGVSAPPPLSAWRSWSPLAGGAGAVLRALLIHHVGLRRADPLPVGTMVVNASGSLLLGVLTGLSLYHGLGSHLLAVAGVGLCGGYTTWSTASWETIHLLHTGHRSEAVVYTLGGLVVCIGAAAAGLGLMALA